MKEKKSGFAPSSRGKREIIICTLIIVVLLLSLLADLSVIRLPDFMVQRTSNPEDLLLTLFTVQASITAVSIAILSIITGSFGDTILGVSVTSYITNIKPVFFSHKTLIIIDLVVTIINYFCAACLLFNVSVLIFVLSILITITLAIDVYVIFCGSAVLQNEIHNYVIQHYNADYLNMLSKDVLTAVESNNSLVLSTDLSALRDIFQIELTREEPSQALIDQISQITMDCFELVVPQHSSKKTLQLVNFIFDLYQTANNASTPIPLHIWYDVIPEYIRGLSDLTFEQLIDEHTHLLLRNALYKNLYAEQESVSGDDSLKYYASWIYGALFNERKMFSPRQEDRLKKGLYETVFSQPVYGASESETIRDIEISELCLLNKCLIDAGDYQPLNKYFFEHNIYYNDSPEFELVFVITLIYLYYLSSREGLVEGTALQESARKILTDNHHNISDFHLYTKLGDIVSRNYNFIRNLMSRWEQLEEGRFTVVIMEEVIQDFLVFSLLESTWNVETLTAQLRPLFVNEILSAYHRYFGKAYIDEFKRDYEKYCALFSCEKDEEQLTERIQILQDVMNFLYKEKLLQDGEEHAITEGDLERFSEQLTRCFDTVIKTCFCCFQGRDLDGDTQKDYIDIHDATVFSISLPNDLLQRDTLAPIIERSCRNSCISFFLNTLLGKIKLTQVTVSDKEKQQKLISQTEENGVQGTVVIGNRDSFWGEADPQQLSAYTKEMSRIAFPAGHNYYFIFDSRLIEFSFSNLRITYEELTEDEIAARCRPMMDGKIPFKVTNDIYLPFGSEELKSHLRNTEKKVIVTADVKYRLAKPVVGSGIRIIPDKKDS